MSSHQGKLAERIQAVLAASSDRLDDMVRVVGLDPRTDLRFGDWRALNLADADLRGFDFTGADFTGAEFDRAHIAGAIFDRAIYDFSALRKAADFDEFVRIEIERSNETGPPDRRLKDFQRFRDTPLCPELIVIPVGEFLMDTGKSESWYVGDDSEVEVLPIERWTKISDRFAVGRYCVTADEFRLFLRGSRKHQRPEYEHLFEQKGDVPIFAVSWDDANDYCDWLNERTGLTRNVSGFRLPSETEWEYACQMGAGEGLSPKEYPRDQWGLRGTVKHIWQWCVSADPSGVRVLCDGPWRGYGRSSRIFYDGNVSMNDNNNKISFRIARTIENWLR
jgi:formylglycine-generating enzyme required for sulfatase activity